MNLLTKIIDTCVESFELSKPTYAYQKASKKGGSGLFKDIELFDALEINDLKNNNNLDCLVIKTNPVKSSIKNELQNCIKENLSDTGSLFLIFPTESRALVAFYKYMDLSELFSIHALINFDDQDSYGTILFLQRDTKKNTLVCELNNTDFEDKKSLLCRTIHNFKLNDEIQSNDVKSNLIGDYIKIDRFFNFSKHEALKKFRELEFFYKDSIQYKFGEIIEEIYSCDSSKNKIDDGIIETWKEVFKKNRNQIIILNKNCRELASSKYFSKDRPINRSFIKNNHLIILKKHFDQRVILNYLNSEIGMAIKKAYSGVLRRRRSLSGYLHEKAILGKNSIEQLPILILLPRKTYDFSVEQAVAKIQLFIDNLKLIENEGEIQEHNKNKLQKLLDLIGADTNEERALKRLSEEESKNLEFKSGFSMDDNQKQNNDLTIKIFETICAFLNTDGGHIYCGIRDSGELLGIDEEINTIYNSNPDNFLLNFYQKFEKYIGKSKTMYISAELLNINSKMIFEIEVKPCIGDYGSYFQDDETVLIVRPANRNQKLKGREIAKYLSHREN